MFRGKLLVSRSVYLRPCPTSFLLGRFRIGNLCVFLVTSKDRILLSDLGRWLADDLMLIQFGVICRTHWNCKMANETLGRLTIYRQTGSFAEPAIKVALLRCIRVFTAVEKTKQSLAFPGINGWGLESRETQILKSWQVFSCFACGMGCQHCKIWLKTFDSSKIVETKYMPPLILVCCLLLLYYLSMPMKNPTEVSPNASSPTQRLGGTTISECSWNISFGFPSWTPGEGGTQATDPKIPSMSVRPPEVRNMTGKIYTITILKMYCRW